MKQLFYLLIITFTCLFTLTGCWDRNELNDLAVIVGFAIDKSEDDEFLVTLQIINSGEVGTQMAGGSGTPVTVRSQKAATLYEATRKASTMIPRRLYISHLRVLVISEEIAKDGISDILDFISRDRDFRSDFYVIVAKESKASHTLEILTSMEKIPADQLHTSLETSQKVWAETVNVSFKDLIKNATVEGDSIVLSGIEIKGDYQEGKTMKNTESSDSAARFAYSGIALFDKFKLIGWLKEEEGKGYSYITDRITSTVEYINCPDGGKMLIEILHSKTKLKSKIKKGNKPKIIINSNNSAFIGESTCAMDLTNPKTIRKVETLFEKEIQSIINKSIAKVQEKYQADIFGFGQEIHISHPKAWRKLKDDWSTEFSQLDVEVNVNITIKNTGAIGETIKEKMKE